MAEIPEYQRKSGIEVSGPATSGIGRALGEGGKRYGKIEEFGNQISQQMANQRAIESGLEAGKTPGRMLLPAFSESDKNFVKAYKLEESNTLQFRGTELLQKLNFEAMKDPTNSSLKQYEENAKRALSEIVNMAPTEYKSDLERSLKSSYLQGFYQLSRAVDGKNRAYILSERKVQDQQDVEGIQNANLNGDYDIANEKYENRLRKIEQYENLGKEGSDLGYTPEQANHERTQAKVAFILSQKSHEARQAVVDDKLDEFIADLRLGQHKDLTPLENDQMVDHVIKDAKNYQSGLDGSRYMAYMEALKLGALNQLTPEVYEEKKLEMGREYAAQLDLKLAKQASKVESAQNLFLGASLGGLDNAVNMSQYSNKQADKIFGVLLDQAKLRGIEPSLTNMADLASGINHEVPMVRDAIASGFKNGNYEQRREAANAYKYLAIQQPEVIHGMDNKTSKALSDFADGVKGGVNPDVLMKNSDEELKPISEEAYRQRAEDLTKVKNKMGWNQPGKMKAALSSQIGISATYIDDGAAYIYGKNFDEYYLDTGDVDKAKEYAARAIERTHGFQEVNGFKEYTYLPVDKLYDAGEGTNWVQANFYADMKDQLHLHKEAFNDGMQPWYYEMDDKTNLEQFFKSTLKPGEPINRGPKPSKIKITKLDAEGKKIKEGLLVFKSDNSTGMPEEGLTASQGVYMLVNGRYEPINLPFSNSQTRFTPELQDIKKYKMAEQHKFTEKQKRVLEQEPIPKYIGVFPTDTREL